MMTETYTISKYMSDQAIARQRREYHPCENGVHIFQSEGGEFGGLTLRNFPNQTLEPFERHSTAGQDRDFDLVCDFMVDGSIEKDCCIRRQDLAIIQREIGDGEP